VVDWKKEKNNVMSLIEVHKSPLFSEDIIISVFGFLCIKEIATGASVCKSWQNASESDYLWRFLVLERWGVMTTSLKWKEFYKNNHQKEIEEKIISDPSSLSPTNTVLRARQRQEAINSGGFVTQKEGQEMAKKIGAICYMECSSLKLNGVKEIFHKAILTSDTFKKKEKKKCLVQ